MGGGRKPKLKENDLDDLKKILKTRESWLIKDAEKLIQSKYNVNYGYHGVRNLLIKLNVPISNHFEIKKHNKNQVLDNINNLSDDNMEQIKKISLKIKEEKSEFVLRKLSYLLLRYLGYTNKQASDMHSITTATGNNWFKTWEKEGYEGLKRKRGQGRKKKLNDKKIKILKKTKRKG